MKRSAVSVALFASAMFAAGLVVSAPAGAKPLPFSVTLTASPPAYSGPCSVTVKYTGEISGKPGAKLSYQIARIIGGTPSVTPWTSTTMTPTGKLLVPDTISVTAAQAGIETETLRVLPGPANATVKISITCVAPKPTPKPSVSFVSGSTTITPAPSPKPSHTPFSNPGVMLAPGAAAVLPPPINLTQAVPSPTLKDAQDKYCPTRGGSACSLALYIGLPAGKLALVWDYPYSNAIDGYNVYRADTSPSGPMTLHMATAPKPIATQADPGWKFVVLDAQRAGSCFAVTAYHGSAESARSIRFCVGEGGIGKQVSLTPDTLGEMIYEFDTYYLHSVQDDMLGQPTVTRGYSNLSVGFSHVPNLFGSSHNDVHGYANSLFRGYVHFNTSSLVGRHIAQAQLHLVAGQTQGPTNGQTCLAYYGAADHIWSSSDHGLGFTSRMGGSRYQGPELRLDVTALAQSWADSPSSNKGIALDGDQPLVIYNMVILSSTCLTNFPTATLDVTYY
jgi:hypothetical protein